MSKAKAIRITGARTGLTEDVRGRQRRYMFAMVVRTVCVILAVVLWQESRIAAIVALVGGTVIPYFAVVFANAGREGAPKTPETFQIDYVPPPALGPGPSADVNANVNSDTQP
ncbi:DUF3099 domain-containing protein [Streptacidiphilus jiangxiensis]|uniref:DUF3099 domain-containing protein n=1 Tax=Streptacidiphilus jiangxiensis TaxID=235985 RepID=A0A1H7VQM5_STRJI|nr:DUF3099 domain-containing protein [Streptacidiphilus jiangxiensis]SEM11088.1 Protein of unknown function [Streptacidiphilus jiangxiensis]